MALVDFFLLGYLLLTVGALLALWYAGIGTGPRATTVATTVGRGQPAALAASGAEHESAGVGVSATLDGP